MSGECSYEEYKEKIIEILLFTVVDEIPDEEVIELENDYFQKLMDAGFDIGLYAVGRKDPSETKEEYFERYQKDEYSFDYAKTNFDYILVERGYNGSIYDREVLRTVDQSILDKYEIYKKPYKGDYLITYKDGKKGVIDYEGNVLVDCISEQVDLNSEQTILKLRTRHSDDNLKYDAFVYLPTKSAYIGECCFTNDEGDYISICELKEEKYYWGAVDLYCRSIVPCKYEDVETENNRIKATKSNGRADYYDFEGNLLEENVMIKTQSTTK